jgi:hypothetical protein
VLTEGTTNGRDVTGDGVDVAVVRQAVPYEDALARRTA